VLGAFTKKYINVLEKDELVNLCDLLDCDDENLYKYNQGQDTTVEIHSNKISELFKNYIYEVD
jgi:antitoxin CptB